MALYLAFAGIVGLEAPDATASWLFGAGMAGLSRIWVDALLSRQDRFERAELRALLTKIAQPADHPAAVARRAPEPRQLAVVAVLGFLTGTAVRRR